MFWGGEFALVPRKTPALRINRNDIRLKKLYKKLRWQSPQLLLPVGMELDFGGIRKEYTADRAYELLAVRYWIPFVINFGGNLRTNRPPSRPAATHVVSS
jgi:thiamine biosynthesis lipoprotein ApbE